MTTESSRNFEICQKRYLIYNIIYKVENSGHFDFFFLLDHSKYQATHTKIINNSPVFSLNKTKKNTTHAQKFREITCHITPQI